MVSLLTLDQSFGVRIPVSQKVITTQQLPDRVRVQLKGAESESLSSSVLVRLLGIDCAAGIGPSGTVTQERAMFFEDHIP